MKKFLEFLTEEGERYVKRSTHPDALINNYKNVEEVPISWLKKLPGNGLRRSPDEMVEYTNDIRKNGLKEPLIVMVGKTSRTAELGEGNHRLAALSRMGMTHAPTRVMVGSEWGKKHGNSAQYDHDIIPKHGEYFNSDPSPSETFRSLQKKA